MPAGFEFYNTAGEVTCSILTNSCRIIERLEITTSSGSKSYPGITGNLFIYFRIFYPGFYMGNTRISGSTVIWDGIPPARLPGYLIVGVTGI